MKIEMKYILFLILILSMSDNIFSQDTIYGLPLNLLSAISQPNKAISSKKIKIADEYYHWDSIYHNDTSYLFNRTKYDKKGRVIEKIEYDQDYRSYQLKCSAKIDWISDTTALARIIYNKDYNDGELISRHDESTGDYLGIFPCLRKIESTNKYYSDIKIDYNKNNVLKSIIYLDSLGKSCLYYKNRQYSDVVKLKDIRSDTVFYPNNKIKKFTYRATVDSQRTSGYLQDAYSFENIYNYTYDSIGRLIETIVCRRNMLNIYYNDTTKVDTARTSFIYYDSARYRAILGADGTNGYYTGNVYFNYNNNGNLISVSHDKIDDGIVDDEYFYNGNETIHRYTFFEAGLKDRILTIETYYKDDLVIEQKFYFNNKIKTDRTLYTYSKKEKKLKNKIITKLPY